MKKLVIAIVVTALVMLQIFYYLMVNATTTFGHTLDGRQIVSVDIGLQTFNYWSENVDTQCTF